MSENILSSSELEHIVSVIDQSGIIAYPTEAVYGLGCAPGDSAALTKLIALKNRPDHKGLIVIAASAEQLVPWVDFDKVVFNDELYQSWPGPNTWLVPARPDIDVLLTGGSDLLAVRVSAHPVVIELCQALGPLTSTSANLSEQPAATSIEQLQQYFPEGLDYVVPGPLGGNQKPSTIRHSMTGELIRPGG